MLNSQCGFSCGYAIEKKTLSNPVDNVLVFASHHFPLDYILFFVLVVYIFVACLYGIVKLGIKITCITVSNIIN
jgi:hypothetical protein